jgi:hypothetical protein
MPAQSGWNPENPHNQSQFSAVSKEPALSASLPCAQHLTVRGTLVILPLPNALVAQLDRVPGFEPGCRRFESFRARQKVPPTFPLSGQLHGARLIRRLADL